jgi:hypothetical protein
MTTTKIALFAGVAVLIAGGLVLAIRMNQSTSSNDGHGAIAAPVAAVRQTGQIDQLNPFTNVASIPAIVDPSTIRFEKVRSVELASKTKTTTDDAQDCKERQLRDPQNTNCQTTTVVERVKAIEATYSFNGVVLSSDESGTGRGTFAVYFRPEEVNAGVDGPVEKLKRDQAASLFQVSTYRATVEQQGIDKQNSHFCEGDYIAGNWVRKDPKCQDQVQYISQTAPSPYLTVQVDLRRQVASK